MTGNGNRLRMVEEIGQPLAELPDPNSSEVLWFSHGDLLLLAIAARTGFIVYTNVKWPGHRDWGKIEK